jgi:hypothetical protein
VVRVIRGYIPSVRTAVYQPAKAETTKHTNHTKKDTKTTDYDKAKTTESERQDEFQKRTHNIDLLAYCRDLLRAGA